MRRWRRVAVAGIVVAAAACTDKKAPPGATVPTPATSAAVPTAPVSTAPPTTAALGEQVTTVEAAQRLLDLFAHLDGEAARMLLTKGAPDAEFDQALQAVYVGLELEKARAAFQREADLGFVGYTKPQPNTVLTATDVVDARSPDCVVVRGTMDLRPRYAEPVPAIDGIFVLVLHTGLVASGRNPTPWRMALAGKPEAGANEEAICPGS